MTLFAGPALARAAVNPHCFWVHGRLMAYNGTPTFRLWPSGGHRLLGIECGERGCGEAAQVLPQKLLKYDPGFGRILWGDFRVCPLDRERAGWMLMVRLSDARNVTLEVVRADR